MPTAAHDLTRCARPYQRQLCASEVGLAGRFPAVAEEGHAVKVVNAGLRGEQVGVLGAQVLVAAPRLASAPAEAQEGLAAQHDHVAEVCVLVGARPRDQVGELLLGEEVVVQYFVDLWVAQSTHLGCYMRAALNGTLLHAYRSHETARAPEKAAASSVAATATECWTGAGAAATSDAAATDGSAAALVRSSGRKRFGWWRCAGGGR